MLSPRFQVRKALKAARTEAVAHFTPAMLDSAKRAAANPRAKLNSKWVQQTHEAVQVNSRTHTLAHSLTHRAYNNS